MSNQSTIVNAVVSVIFKNIKGTSFVGVRNYTSKSSGDQVSNQTFLVGVNRVKRLEQDLVALTNFNVAPVAKLYGQAVADKAKLDLMISLQKVLAPDNVKEMLRAQGDKTIRRSDGQKDAYTWLNAGLKLHNVTGDIYVDGYCINKTVLVEGTPQADIRKDLTKAKDLIKKLADLKDRKYRCFKVGNKATLKLQGITLPW